MDRAREWIHPPYVRDSTLNPEVGNLIGNCYVISRMGKPEIIPVKISIYRADYLI
jgi:hypothetical protein